MRSPGRPAAISVKPRIGSPIPALASANLEDYLLIAAARELFGTQGYEGTSIDAILQAAGVARGALYHHFANKAELFDAVLDREAAAVAEAARAVDDPLDSLRAGCGAFLRLALDPAVQRITLLDSPAVVGWERWRELDEQHILGGLRAGVSRLADAGRPIQSRSTCWPTWSWPRPARPPWSSPPPPSPTQRSGSGKPPSTPCSPASSTHHEDDVGPATESSRPSLTCGRSPDPRSLRRHRCVPLAL